MIPVIGLLAEIDDECAARVMRSYAEAIEDNGGLPLLLPYIENDEAVDRFIDVCDGFLFTGGVDVEPRKYGEETHPKCGTIRLFRDDLELRVAERALKTGKPIMGICRGIQLLNVALGGKLYQDIPSEIPSDIPHAQSEPKTSPSHSVNVIEGTPLHALAGKTKMVANSFHHQAISTLGEGLEVMALADDGIIEAVYLPSAPYFRAYQWHPERLFKTDGDNRAIFVDFINAAKNKA